MRFYNSLTNKIEEFKPIYPDKVMMYFCGPTVYNYAHIGNARAAITGDLFWSVLKANGYNVLYASNYTDIDDKIITVALNQNKDALEVSSFFIEEYRKDMNSLGITTANFTPKVSDTMDKIIHFIEELVDKGYAYELDGDVYFRVSKLENYGLLSKHQLEDLMNGQRIEEDKRKEHPADFALWKQTSQGRSWESKFSKGRPGWHSECVVMIQDVFKESKIDIHGGGSDLRFPHHENEIAQSLACCNSTLANYWVHNGMLQVDGGKMSKSLGNIILAKDFAEKYGKNLARFILLSAHYRSNLILSDDVISSLQKQWKKIEEANKQICIALSLLDKVEYDDNLNEWYNQFMEYMNNDLQTPNAYSVIYDLVKTINQHLRQKKDYQNLLYLQKQLIKILNVLGIDLPSIQLSEEDIQLFKNWENAKKEKNFELADKFRQVLIDKGYL